jgi:hypothetical protein
VVAVAFASFLLLSSPVSAPTAKPAPIPIASTAIAPSTAQSRHVGGRL